MCDINVTDIITPYGTENRYIGFTFVFMLGCYYFLSLISIYKTIKNIYYYGKYLEKYLLYNYFLITEIFINLFINIVITGEIFHFYCLSPFPISYTWGILFYMPIAPLYFLHIYFVVITLIEAIYSYKKGYEERLTLLKKSIFIISIIFVLLNIFISLLCYFLQKYFEMWLIFGINNILNGLVILILIIYIYKNFHNLKIKTINRLLRKLSISLIPCFFSFFLNLLQWIFDLPLYSFIWVFRDMLLLFCYNYYVKFNFYKKYKKQKIDLPSNSEKSKNEKKRKYDIEDNSITTSLDKK